MEFIDMLCAEMSAISDHRKILPTYDFHNDVSMDSNHHQVGCNCVSEIVLDNLIVFVRALRPHSIKPLSKCEIATYSAHLNKSSHTFFEAFPQQRQDPSRHSNLLSFERSREYHPLYYLSHRP